MIAARTRRIKMGPSVLTLPDAPSGTCRQDLRDARLYLRRTHDHGGRQRQRSARPAASGVPSEDRGKRLDEGITILRRLWTESHVTHHGQFYDFDDVTIEPKPRKGSLDIWIGGKSDAILKRVVRLGDGWFPALTSPDEFKRDMDKLMAFGEQAGRPINPRESGVLLLTHYRRPRARRARSAPSCAALPMPPEDIAGAQHRRTGGRMRRETPALRRSRLRQVRPAALVSARRSDGADRSLRQSRSCPTSTKPRRA